MHRIATHLTCLALTFVKCRRRKNGADDSQMSRFSLLPLEMSALPCF